MFAQLLRDRARMEEQREAASAEAASTLVAELAAWAPGRTDAEVEDELCRRTGARLREWDDAPLEQDHVPRTGSVWTWFPRPGKPSVPG